MFSRNFTKRFFEGFFNTFLFFALTFSSFCFHNVYNPLSPEVILLVSVISLCCMGCYLLLSLFQKTWVYYGLLIMLFFDLSFAFVSRDFWSHLFLFPNFTYFPFCSAHLLLVFLTTSVRWVYCILPLMVIVWFAYLGRRVIAKYFLIFISVMLLVTIVQFLHNPNEIYREHQREELSLESSDLPNIFIFILDEHIGVEGIPNITSYADKFKNQLRDYYIQNGFQVYGRAYSNYPETRRSLKSIFNYSLDEMDLSETELSTIGAARVLESLAQKGYQFRFYETTYLDFCQSFKDTYKSCFEYIPNSIGFLKQTSLTLFEKFRLLLHPFVYSHKSGFLHMLHKVFLEKYFPGYELRPLSDQKIIDAIKQDLNSDTKGTLFLAHFLFPHHPYIYTSDCSIKKIDDWNTFGLSDGEDMDSEYRKSYEKYFHQATCTHKRIDSFFNELKKKGLFDQSIIILLGDHGTRIATHELRSENIKKLVERDFVDGFSTFLAIKKAHLVKKDLLKGEYVNKKVSITQVIGDFFGILPYEDGIKQKLENVFLFTQKKKEKMLSVPMVDF